MKPKFRLSERLKSSSRKREEAGKMEQAIDLQHRIEVACNLNSLQRGFNSLLEHLKTLDEESYQMLNKLNDNVKLSADEGNKILDDIIEKWEKEEEKEKQNLDNISPKQLKYDDLKDEELFIYFPLLHARKYGSPHDVAQLLSHIKSTLIDNRSPANEENSGTSSSVAVDDELFYEVIIPQVLLAYVHDEGIRKAEEFVELTEGKSYNLYDTDDPVVYHTFPVAIASPPLLTSYHELIGPVPIPEHRSQEKVAQKYRTPEAFVLDYKAWKEYWNPSGYKVPLWSIFTSTTTAALTDGFLHWAEAAQEYQRRVEFKENHYYESAVELAEEIQSVFDKAHQEATKLNIADFSYYDVFQYQDPSNYPDNEHDAYHTLTESVETIKTQYKQLLETVKLFDAPIVPALASLEEPQPKGATGEELLDRFIDEWKQESEMWSDANLQGIQPSKVRYNSLTDQQLFTHFPLLHACKHTTVEGAVDLLSEVKSKMTYYARLDQRGIPSAQREMTTMAVFWNVIMPTVILTYVVDSGYSEALKFLNKATCKVSGLYRMGEESWAKTYLEFLEHVKLSYLSGSTSDSGSQSNSGTDDGDHHPTDRTPKITAAPLPKSLELKAAHLAAPAFDLDCSSDGGSCVLWLGMTNFDIATRQLWASVLP
ncbi:hypothetical protein IWQ62_001497 [Dispira parvispora]|uniref:Uncharacterized protein n=1 Tax=Dispira parvispora TaxID=1520584 RepID=A0A9W8ASF1_9FUNG|nr:hypothetical protein IWQ62_001497 [Dispira parvispora]